MSAFWQPQALQAPAQETSATIFLPDKLARSCQCDKESCGFRVVLGEPNRHELLFRA